MLREIPTQYLYELFWAATLTGVRLQLSLVCVVELVHEQAVPPLQILHALSEDLHSPSVVHNLGPNVVRMFLRYCPRYRAIETLLS